MATINAIDSGNPIEASRGGTGINNGSSTFTMAGSTSFVGAFTFAGTVTGNTAVTFPTSGTLATTSQIPSLPLSLANGGTNANLTASNGGIFYSTATAGAILSGTATANQALLSGSSTAPSWSTATYPATTTAFQLLVSTAANTIGGLTVGATGTVLTGVTGAVPAFSATPSVTSITLNGGTALGAYVESTFTPSLTFGGGNTGITYSNQLGTYIRIGNIFMFRLLLQLSNKGSSTGSAVITGLPFTFPAIGTFQYAVGSYDALTLSLLYTTLVCYAGSGAANISLLQIGSGQALAAVADTNFANGTSIYITGTYTLI